MSWKNVWLITTLVAVASTHALSINVTTPIHKKHHIGALEKNLNNILGSYKNENHKVVHILTNKPVNFEEVIEQNDVGPDKNTDPSNPYDVINNNENLDVTIPGQVDVKGTTKLSDKIYNSSMASPLLALLSSKAEGITRSTKTVKRIKFLSEIEDNHETRQYGYEETDEGDNDRDTGEEDGDSLGDGEEIEDGGNGDNGGDGDSEEGGGNGEDGSSGEDEGNGDDGGSGDDGGNGEDGGDKGSGEDGGNGEGSVESTTPAPTMNIIVKTDFGDVRGYVWPNFDEIISFMDIPYGQFTLFEAPQKPDTWETVHDVKEHNKRCPQMDNDIFVGSSDCLTLSIFAPKDVGQASVLFYIHQSNSKTGSGSPALYGPEYMVQKGVILVLPNYRLGALGFLCLQNDTAPGNAALKDLALALEWTKNNIEAFGGDPSNIVISGDGTSGALAGYLALSSTSKNYISKVITESGSLLSHWAIDRNPISTATELADHIRKSNEETEFMDNIFSDINVELLIRTSDYAFLRPCIEDNDNGILKNKPWFTLNNEAINISFIIGSANYAGLAEALQYDNQALSQLNENFEDALPNDLNFDSTSLGKDMGQKIREQYFGTDTITTDDVKSLSLYLTDVSYLGPDLRLARALTAAGATVYLYEFSFIGGLNKELNSIDDAPHYGAIRGDVAGYIFTQDGRIPSVQSEDKKVVDLMTDLWVSFIQNGYPTADGVNWNKFNESEDTWLSIGAETSPETGFHDDRLTIWTEIYREYFIDRSAAFHTKPGNCVFHVAVLCLVKFL